LFVKVAEAALSRLRHLPSLHWRVEEAELFWARGELETAKRMMKLLIDDMETVRLIACSLCAKCLMCFAYGKLVCGFLKLLLDHLVSKRTPLEQYAEVFVDLWVFTG